MIVQRTKKSKKIPIIVLSTLLLLAVAVGIFLLVRSRHDDAKPSSSDAAGSGSSINYNPPTEAEKQETIAHKDDITNPQGTPQTTDSGMKKVTPVVSGGDTSSVNAYVLGVFEEGGTCTATITQGTYTLTKTSTGFENSSYTQCAPIELGSNSLDKTKKWNITVAYSSNTSQGTSDVATISP